LIEPNLVPKLDGLAGLLSADNGRVWIEQAEDLFCGGYLFLLEDPANGLIHRLFDAWDEGLQGLCKAFSGLFAFCLHEVHYFLGLSDGGSSDGELFDDCPEERVRFISFTEHSRRPLYP
jgi:hypothetical protein